MRRRTVITAIGAGGISLSGCLSRGPGGIDAPAETKPSNANATSGESDRRYEACPREVIPYEQFPEDVRAEIGVALDGRYTADRVFLREAMDTEESYVSVDGEYYDPTVAVDGDEETLGLEVVQPKALPRPRSISVERDRDGERTITVEVADDEGAVLIDRTRSVPPGGTTEFGRTTRVGTHDLRVTVADGDRIETVWTGSMRVGESYFDTTVVIAPEEIYTTGAVADLGVCRYKK